MLLLVVYKNALRLVYKSQLEKEPPAGRQTAVITRDHCI